MEEFVKPGQEVGIRHQNDHPGTICGKRPRVLEYRHRLRDKFKCARTKNSFESAIHLDGCDIIDTGADIWRHAGQHFGRHIHRHDIYRAECQENACIIPRSGAEIDKRATVNSPHHASNGIGLRLARNRPKPRMGRHFVVGCLSVKIVSDSFVVQCPLAIASPRKNSSITTNAIAKTTPQRVEIGLLYAKPYANSIKFWETYGRRESSGFAAPQSYERPSKRAYPLGPARDRYPAPYRLHCRTLSTISRGWACPNVDPSRRHGPMTLPTSGVAAFRTPAESSVT
jgi:hypothetical protein